MTSPNQDGRVTTQVADGVATVSFHHPKGNSLPGAILARLAEEIAALGSNPAATVIVLRSEGDGPFCAGASFQELQAVRTPEAGQRFFMGFARLILAMTRCPKFILVRLHEGGWRQVASAPPPTTPSRYRRRR
jgi:methylglutaconyl-CoA hydratase